MYVLLVCEFIVTACIIGTCNIYKSKWFAFEVLKFLDEEVQLRKSIRVGTKIKMTYSIRSIIIYIYIAKL